MTGCIPSCIVSFNLSLTAHLLPSNFLLVIIETTCASYHLVDFAFFIAVLPAPPAFYVPSIPWHWRCGKANIAATGHTDCSALCVQAVP